MNTPQTADPFQDTIAAIATPPGEPIRLRNAGANRWRFRRNPRGRIQISYEVELSHMESPFPYGHYGATYLREDSVYFTTAAVLIVSERVEQAMGRVDVPDDWRVSTPWAKASYQAREYRVLGHRELLESCLLVGTHQEKTLEVLGAKFTLAVGNDFPGAHDLLTEPLEKVVHATAELFGGLTRKRYLVVVNESIHPGEEGGTGQYQGMSLLLPKPRGKDLEETWAHALTHEFLHMWNGIAMRPARPDGEWFNEGITEYLTTLLVSRMGLASPTYPLRYLTVLYDGYRKQTDRPSLMAGGERKGANFYLIYGGGMAFGLLLDQEIRSGSNYKYGIEDLMRGMFAEFGEDKRYRVSDINRVASDLAGNDLSPLFDLYVEGVDLIPLDESLRRIGLDLTWTGDGGRASIRRIPRPTAEARRLHSFILGEMQ